MIKDIIIVPWFILNSVYRQTSDIKLILVANKIVDNSDVVGAAPTSSFPT